MLANQYWKRIFPVYWKHCISTFLQVVEIKLPLHRNKISSIVEQNVALTRHKKTTEIEIMHTQVQTPPKTPKMSPYERNIHERDHRYQDELKAAEIAQKRKNPPNFTQVTPAGWSMIVKIGKDAPSALPLFSFFAEHIDESCGAVVCDQKFLAERFGVGIRTVYNWIKQLENLGALLRIPVGQTYAYALDPLQVWKGYNTSKDYAVFNTKTLTDRNGEINRKLRIMMSERGMPIDPNQADLVDDLTE